MPQVPCTDKADHKKRAIDARPTDAGQTDRRRKNYGVGGRGKGRVELEGEGKEGAFAMGRPKKVGHAGPAAS